jgi:hypothetical protein
LGSGRNITLDKVVEGAEEVVEVGEEVAEVAEVEAEEGGEGVVEEEGVNRGLSRHVIQCRRTVAS